MSYHFIWLLCYGRPTADSNVDLLVIMPKKRDRGERISVRIRQAVPRNFSLDLLVRTPKEVAQRLRWGDVFLREVMEKGKVIYEINNPRVGEKSAQGHRPGCNASPRIKSA